MSNGVNASSIVNGFYVDKKKGLTADCRKITHYLLKPESDHYNEFADVGYCESFPDQLMNDILREYNAEAKFDYVSSPSGKDKYSVLVVLGLSKKRTFRTVWETALDGGPDRLITAYRDRRVEEHDE